MQRYLVEFYVTCDAERPRHSVKLPLFASGLPTFETVVLQYYFHLVNTLFLAGCIPFFLSQPALHDGIHLICGFIADIVISPIRTTIRKTLIVLV